MQRKKNVVKRIIKSILSEPCTFWPNKWGDKDWSKCCTGHDSGYDKTKDMLGYDQEAYRLMSDEELRSCVNSIMPGMGSIMFYGVRLFGRWRI